MSFAEDYVDVASRIAIFREKYPEGSLQPYDPTDPAKLIVVGDKTFIQYVACAYRTADDTRPGIGTAWEPFPGKTPYTRDSEAMVAETSAWGRAIVAVLAADTKRGIASAEEVRNRRTDQAAPQETEETDPIKLARIAVASAWEANNGSFVAAAVEKNFTEWSSGEVLMDATADRLYQYAEHLKGEAGA
jgi:hypothetical protein